MRRSVVSWEVVVFFKKSIDSIKSSICRDELVRRSRVLVVDDERPEVIDDLKNAGFAVDYEPDITNSNMKMIERSRYDLILLDFGNVGGSFGSDEGLSLLRHVKRVNPSLVVIAYTSKSLGTDHADFYRLADGVLAKDAGIQESLEKIEDGLRKALSIENLWSGLLSVAEIPPNSTLDKQLQDLLVRGLESRRKMTTLRNRISALLGSEAAQKLAIGLITKIVEIAVKSCVEV